MIPITYRGYTIEPGNGSWIAYKVFGHNIGGSFHTAWCAKVYIDELLSP